MNIALCFCVRNCEQYLKEIFINIDHLKTLNINVFSIFVYDNCNDNTKSILENYQINTDNVIIRNITNNNNLRTVRIANARNECLKIVYNELTNIKYHIMIDCDDVCTPRWDINIIDKYLNNFDNDNWDCISFNLNNYYDIWALLVDDFKHHCWGFAENSSKVVKIMRAYINDKLANCKTNSIEVMSAFNGFCIYKTDRFKGFHYDGSYSSFDPLITDVERANVENWFKDVCDLNVKCDKNRQECCEHLFFHLNAFKQGRKIKISKFNVIQN